MDIFARVKGIVTPKAVAQRYLGEPVKMKSNTWFYYSPLRAKERTASLAVNDKKGFTDFGTGENYDIFDFISKLYSCGVRKACYIIANDFNIDIDNKLNKASIDIMKKQTNEEIIIQKTINKWHDYMYSLFTSMYKEYHNLKLSLSSNSDLLPFVYKKEMCFDYLSELFFDNDANSKIQLYKNKERFDIYERKGNLLR